MEYLKVFIEDSTLTGDDLRVRESYEQERAAASLTEHATVRRDLDG